MDVLEKVWRNIRETTEWFWGLALYKVTSWREPKNHTLR